MIFGHSTVARHRSRAELSTNEALALAVLGNGTAVLVAHGAQETLLHSIGCVSWLVSSRRQDLTDQRSALGPYAGLEVFLDRIYKLAIWIEIYQLPGSGCPARLGTYSSRSDYSE